MEKNTGKINFYFYASIACAIWFLLTSALWAYLANLFISFPFGLLSFFLLRKGQQLDGNKKRYKIPVGILIAGIVISLVALVILTMYN